MMNCKSSKCAFYSFLFFSYFSMFIWDLVFAVVCTIG